MNATTKEVPRLPRGTKGIKAHISGLCGAQDAFLGWRDQRAPVATTGTCVVGAIVGATVGNIVGASVGRLVGAIVGCSVVGVTVGTSVGAFLGDVVCSSSFW